MIAEFVEMWLWGVNEWMGGFRVKGRCGAGALNELR
jgi:hypothetical protein